MRAVPNGHLRTMAWATLVNTSGWGLWGAAEALYLTRIVGLSPLQVGTGMTVGGIIGLSASVPLGRIADRRDPRALRSAIQLGQCAVAASYLFIDSFWAFLALGTLEALLMTSNITVRAALVSVIGGPTGRVHAFAVLRVVSRIGQSAGAAAAALALTIDTKPAYDLLIAGNSATYLASALLLMRLPPFPPVGATRRKPSWRALKDGPFLAVTTSSAVMALHRPVLGVLLPLWVATHTASPRAAVSAVLVVDMLVGMVATIPATRNLINAAAAARALRWGGAALSIGMLLYALAGLGNRPVSFALLMLATVAYAVGDLLHATGDTTLAYELAPPDAIGEYQGANQLLTGAAFALGPIILTALVLNQPAGLGWIGLAVLFTATGLVVPALTRWAVSTRALVRTG